MSKAANSLSPAALARKVDLLPTIELLHRHINASLCEEAFQKVRIAEREREWSLHALVVFWTEVILRAPPSLRLALEEAQGLEADTPIRVPVPDTSFQALSKRCQVLRPAFFAQVFHRLVERVLAWKATPSAFILVPHQSDNFGQPVPLREMKVKYPKAYEYFAKHEKHLCQRAGYIQLLHQRPEFYAIGNTGNYTLAPYKVVFKDLTEFFQCAVTGPTSAGGLGPKPMIPDHTLLFMTCSLEDEAYFYAGLLNSIPCRVSLYSASVGVQKQRYFPTDVSRVKLPKYEPGNHSHATVVRISRNCHETAEIAAEKAEIDLAHKTADIWGISKRELALVEQYYETIKEFRSRDKQESGGEPD